MSRHSDNDPGKAHDDASAIVEITKEYLKENQVVDRYVMGTLDPTELEAFEDYYFENPEILEDIKLAESMQQAMAEKFRSTNTASHEMHLQDRLPDDGFIARIASLIQTPAWSSVATAASIFFGILLISSQGPAGGFTTEPVLRDLVDDLYLTTTRSADEIVTIRREGQMLLEIDVPDLKGKVLSLNIQSSAKEKVVDNFRVTLSDDDQEILTQLIATRSLPDDIYLVTVEDELGGSVEYRFALKRTEQ